MTEDEEHVTQVADLLVEATLGDNIMLAMADATSPFSMLMRKARDEYVASLHNLIDADLVTDNGLAQARSAQANVMRYREMIKWIEQSLETAGEADAALEGIDRGEASEDSEIDKLQQQLRGQRDDQPAPDA